MAQTVIGGGFLNTDLVTAQTALTTGLVSTDELIISDAGVLKRMDIAVLESYIVTNLGDNNIDVAQSSHGFAVGDIIRLTTTNNTYAKALADTAANAESVGVVIDVTDTNNFTYSTSGEITVAGAVPNSTTAGDIVFLSTSSAGGTQTTEPSVTNQISKPLAVITEANNKMILLPYRGEIISGGATSFAPVDATYLAISANGTLTGERVLTAGTGITLTDAGANGAATLSITDDSVTFAKMQNVAANSVLVRNASSSGDLAELALATTQILIGDGTGFTAAALSGDVTMSNAGVVTIAANAVDSDQYVDGSIDVVHLAAAASEKVIQMVVVDFTTALTTGDAKFYFHVPSTLNGFNVVDVHAEVITAPTGRTIEVELYNINGGADILSTPISIDISETGSDTAATAAVIDTGQDDLATNDVIRVDIDYVGSSTAGSGLIVTMICRLP